MPVTQVLIDNIIPGSMDVDVQWQSDQIATTAMVYVALTEPDLAVPANRVTGALPTPVLDTVFRLTIPNIGGGEPPLTAGTQYFCRCECDGILSPVLQFMTSAAVPAPPVAAQDVSILIDPLSPLTLRFSWTGPDSARGRVLMGTVSGSLSLAGEQVTQSERHTVVVSQGLAYNTSYYYKVVSVDGSGAALAQSAEMEDITPKAANPSTSLINPTGGIPFISDSTISGGSRCVISVGTRLGGGAANGHLVEFKLTDPTMGKLGHGNLPGSDRVQLIADPMVFENVVFFSSGKTGNAVVNVQIVGVSTPSARKTATIIVS